MATHHPLIEPRPIIGARRYHDASRCEFSAAGQTRGQFAKVGGCRGQWTSYCMFVFIHLIFSKITDIKKTPRRRFRSCTTLDLLSASCSIPRSSRFISSFGSTGEQLREIVSIYHPIGGGTIFTQRSSLRAHELFKKCPLGSRIDPDDLYLRHG